MGELPARHQHQDILTEVDLDSGAVRAARHRPYLLAQRPPRLTADDAVRFDARDLLQRVHRLLRGISEVPIHRAHPVVQSLQTDLQVPHGGAARSGLQARRVVVPARWMRMTSMWAGNLLRRRRRGFRLDRRGAADTTTGSAAGKSSAHRDRNGRRRQPTQPGPPNDHEPSVAALAWFQPGPIVPFVTPSVSGRRARRSAG